MTDSPLFPVPEAWQKTAWINKEKYQDMYRESIDQPDQFWAQQASEFLTWDSPWETVSNFDFPAGQASWFTGGKLNVAVNCIDRHLAHRADQTALIWESDEPTDDKTITYACLLYTSPSPRDRTRSRMPSSA